MRRVTLLCLPLLVLAGLALALLGGGSGDPRNIRAERLCGEARVPGALAVSGRELHRAGAAEPDEPACEDLDAELQEPADALLQRVAFGSKGTAPTDVLERGQEETAEITALTRQAAPELANVTWQNLGPTNIGGRILDIALDNEDSDTVYVGTAGGGVFKSTDKGVTLAPSWPEDFPMAIGALVMSKSGILYAGTGEAGPGGGALTYGGNGVYRSKDKGRTWEQLPGLEKTSRIGRIVIDPTNEKRIFVAAVGNLFKPTEDRGLYRTEDGGATWKKVLAGDNGRTGTVDVAIDPKNPKRLIAANWDHQRFPDSKDYVGVGSGVYRSTDGGDTWARVGNGLIGPNPLLGRIGVAIDPQNPDNVYAIGSGGVGNHLAFFKSTDFGSTFLPIIDANHAGLSGAFTYGWWFGRVWVDPRNSNNVYTAGLDLLKSSNGGFVFTAVSAGMHVDQHALMWDPKNPQRMWAGNDGGLYRSDDAGASWKLAKVQPFTQPDSIDVSEQDPKRIVVGAQDIGQIRNYAAKDWNLFGPGGDGERVLINPKDKNIVYACGQNGACEVSKDGGDTGTNFENSVISARKLFFMPIEFDPANPSRIFTGGEFVNRSDDDAGSFSVVSPDLSNGPGRETNPLYATGQGGVSAIGVQAGGQKLYAGTDDGNLWTAVSEGEVGIGDWTQISDPDLPKAYVTRIEVDQSKPRVAYVTYSGYRGGDTAAYVLRTADGGQTWDNITGNLPKAPVNDINVVGDKLVVASDFGVFASKDTGQTWYRVGLNLPLSPVYELRTHLPTNTLFVATFGRSVYKVSLDALDGIPAVPPANVPAKVGKRKTYLGLPRLRSCARNNVRFTLRAPKGVKLRRATIYVGRRKVRTLQGKALARLTDTKVSSRKRRITIKLPRRKVVVRIAAVTSTGERISVRRTYRACPKKRR